MYRGLLLNFLVLAMVLSGCATSNHGTFVTSTYVEEGYAKSNGSLGRVRGESRQVWLLYLFPLGKSPSTSQAIVDAKSQIDGTAFLSDVAIDDRVYWKFGYKEQVIEVDATAHR